jgi:CDP-diacylglycerol---serine O-phosphatidyltransferase
VPRVWRRRRNLDQPRPAGRRWARLRRSGSRATKALAHVTFRRRHGDTAAIGTQVLVPRPERSWPRLGPRRPALEAPLQPQLWPPDAEFGGRRADRDTFDPRRPPGPIPLLPGERTQARRFKFALANGCTALSLVVGMTAALLAVHGDIRAAALAVLVCVALDGCDGGLARVFGVASPFGAQMDSMADMSSFGVVTGIVMFEWLLGLGASPVLAGPACALVAVCAAIRLARFNVSPKDGRFFCGVPTTMTAAVFALDILFVGDRLSPTAQVAFVIVYALAMVSSFPYTKLVRVMRLPLWLWVLPAIGAMISVPGSFLAVVGGYLASGPVIWLYLTRKSPDTEFHRASSTAG